MDRDSRYSQGSERFRESTHLIPLPDTKLAKNLRKRPRYDDITSSWAVVFGTALLMVGLGLALEVGTILSSKRGGFQVPPDNIITIVSPQFLLSFVPTILVAPAAFAWREMDWKLRWLQPYLVLWRGHATAEESILLDYITLGPALGLFRAMKWRHRLVFWSAITAMVTYIFQPLAGSIFQLRQKIQVDSSTVTSIKTIGLIPDVDELNAFVAAAGFAEAAVFNHLPDPPFIFGGWATAEFALPTNAGLNGTISVNTTGIQTNTQCATPAETNLEQNAPNAFNLTSKSVDGCLVVVTYDPTVSGIQYGVVDVPCFGNATIDVSLRPVMFWFFHNRTDGTPEAKTVFCTPTIQAFDVTATVNLTSSSLSSVVGLNKYAPPNNVTGSPLNGSAFNGVLFDNQPNPFIQARAISTKSAVPGAIFRFASQLQGGPQSTFDLDNGFLDLTNQVYTQDLSIVAKSVYFVNHNDTLPSEMQSLVPVLWIDPFPGHLLAILLVFTGLVGIVVQAVHQRERRKLLLAAPPGSIAATTALTSHSGFGELLLPYDDEATLERKLKGILFRLDRRTGAIVADDVDTDRLNMGSDDAMLSLLGKRDTGSSAMAAQAAAGYPPWKTPYKP